MRFTDTDYVKMSLRVVFICSDTPTYYRTIRFSQAREMPFLVFLHTCMGPLLASFIFLHL